MVLYNVTVCVDESVHAEWLEWMIKSHIPNVMSTNLFVENKIFRLIDPPPEEGATYSIQYFAENYENFNEYLNVHASRFKDEHSQIFKDKFVVFRTILESL